jgi:hypothetical protein
MPDDKIINDFDLNDDSEHGTTYTLNDALDTLKHQPDHMSAAISYGLSDIVGDDVKFFVDVWHRLDTPTRQTLIAHLVEVSEANFELDYQAVALTALDDTDEVVRGHAIDLMWADESTEHLERLIKIAQWDDSIAVRARATSALGRFVLMGEYSKLPSRYFEIAQDTAVQIWNNDSEDTEVRRRALESLANCGHALVPEAIMEAYNSQDDRLNVSAIHAMGRSCDERWTDIVLKELQSDNPEIRYEAARASGELELESAVSTLGHLLLTDEREVQEAVIWSLGEIGGSAAIKLLEKLTGRHDDEDWDAAIEDALGNANLGNAMLDLLDIPELDLDNLEYDEDEI